MQEITRIEALQKLNEKYIITINVYKEIKIFFENMIQNKLKGNK
jgi:hypothetical protein